MSQTTKDLKVKLPVDYHIQLRTLKILKGKSLSDALAEALDLYFADAKQVEVAEAARILIHAGNVQDDPR